MNYEGQSCPVCGNALREDDDIVVCPECATPHHRECWIQNGNCANAHLHGSGFIWAKEKTEEPVYEDVSEENESRICHICKSENPADALHCGNCGALFDSREHETKEKKCPVCGKENTPDSIHCSQCGAPLDMNFHGNADMPAYVAGTNIPVDEKVGDFTAGDIAVYTRASAGRYVKKFKRFEEGKKVGFNFAALFFSPYWFFYRKLYKAGIFFLVAFVTLNVFISFCTSNILLSKPFEEFYSVVEEYNSVIAQGNDVTSNEVTQITDKLILATQEVIEAQPEKVAVLILIEGLPLLLNLLCALLADKLYYKKFIEDMKKTDENVHEENIRRMLIFKKGGLSVFGFGASLIGETLLINLLYNAAEFIKNI